MGAHIAALVTENLPIAGLILVAPAAYGRRALLVSGRLYPFVL
jgi:hypothetical protein